MTDRREDGFGDPTTVRFWEAAREHRLLVQRCAACGSHQFYPRPFCLNCDRDDVLEWVEVQGAGVVYSVVTVRFQVVPELEPPYQVAVVELAEGPRITTNIVGGTAAIGDPVKLTWRDRDEPFPPVPIFEHLKETP